MIFFVNLQAYTSILYLKKYENFQIILRGKPVEHISVANDLKFKKVVTYKPQVTHDSQVVSKCVKLLLKCVKSHDSHVISKCP
jgi:hypothetical protein